MHTLKLLYESFYRQSFGVIALGDGNNDLAMLETADIPVVVNSPSSRALKIHNPAALFSDQQAPEGWVEGVQKAINKIPMQLKQEINYGR